MTKPIILHDLQKLAANSFDAGSKNLNMSNDLDKFIREKMFYFSGFFITAFFTFDAFSKDLQYPEPYDNGINVLQIAIMFMILIIILGFVAIMIDKVLFLKTAKKNFNHQRIVNEFISQKKKVKVEKIPAELELPSDLRKPKENRFAVVIEIIQFLLLIAGLIEGMIAFTIN